MQLATNTGVLKWYGAKVHYVRLDYTREGPVYKYNVRYNYSDLGVKLVCKVLPALKALRFLNLSCNGTHAAGANELMRALSKDRMDNRIMGSRIAPGTESGPCCRWHAGQEGDATRNGCDGAVELALPRALAVRQTLACS